MSQNNPVQAASGTQTAEAAEAHHGYESGYSRYPAHTSCANQHCCAKMQSVHYTVHYTVHGKVPFIHAWPHFHACSRESRLTAMCNSFGTNVLMLHACLCSLVTGKCSFTYGWSIASACREATQDPTVTVVRILCTFVLSSLKGCMSSLLMFCCMGATVSDCFSACAALMQMNLTSQTRTP